MKFFDDYFKFVGENESPLLYHRWTAVSMIGALLGRQLYLPFGHINIFPNFFIMLVGDPGTRKNTALWPSKRVLKAANFKKFSADRISPESFIFQLEKAGHLIDDIVDNTFDLENLTIDQPSELYVSIGEFGDFIGKGRLDFLDLLANLWDNLPEYIHPKLHGKSVHVNEPTVNIIGGITPQGISMNIPLEAIGQGFMSRFILVTAETNGTKITFPRPVSEEAVSEFAKRLLRIKEHVKGEVRISAEARALFDRLYKEFVDIDDYRFKHYSTRRFTHLIKLCMIFAAMEERTEIQKEDCINANTLLHFTEIRMPRALGEFGKAKHSDVANNILNILRGKKEPLTVKELWKHVAQDLSRQTELVDIVKNLREAGKIQVVTVSGKQGFMPLSTPMMTWKEDLLNPSFLSIDERV